MSYEKIRDDHGHHGHEHNHGDEPCKEHAPALAPVQEDESSRPLYIGAGLCFAFMGVELLGGYVGHSLAVLTDALHMLTDVFSFALAIYAGYAAKQKPTAQFTYGYKRVEVLCALISTLLIWGLTAAIMYEAVCRLGQWRSGTMKAVDGRIMFGVAALGVGFNLVLERVLGGHGGHGHSHGGHAHGHAHAAPAAATEGDLHTDGHSHGHALHSACDQETGHSGHDHSGHDHSGHDHSGHDHSGHDHKGHDHKGHDHSGHDHSGHDHKGHDHSGHDHSGHDHGHGHSESAPVAAAAAPASYGNAPAASSEHGPPARTLNLDAAYLHVLGDLLQSIGVAIAGLLIWYDPEWKVADPICTCLFGCIVMATTLQMLWANVSVLLEGVPPTVNLHHLKAQLERCAGVSGVHDLHVWSLSNGSPICTAHANAADPQAALLLLQQVCLKNGISHATIQVLPDGAPCHAGLCCT